MRAEVRTLGWWDQIGFLLTWILVFLIPWGDMILLPADIQMSRAFTLLAAAAWIPLLWKRRMLRSLETAHLWMLLFVLWAGVTVIQTADPERSLRRVLSFVQLFLDAWIIHQSVRSTERYHKLLIAWVLGCCVCMCGQAFHLVNDIRQGDGRITAPGFDPNDLAVTLVLAIPIAWFLSIRKSSYSWVYLLYIPLAVLATLLSASRGATITLMVALLLPLATITRRFGRAMVSIAVLLVVSGMAVESLSSEISFRRLSTIVEQFTSRDLNGRFDIWQKGYAIFLENPVIGVGAGGFETAAGARRGSGMAAHNALLGVAVEHGLVGLTLFLGAIVSLVRQAWRSTTSDRSLWLILLAAWGVASMNLSWENREMTWLLWGMCAAVPNAMSRQYPRILIWRCDAKAASHA